MQNLRRLFTWLRPYRGRVVLSFCLSIGIAALTALSLSSLIPILEVLFEEGGAETLRQAVAEHLGPYAPGISEWINASLLADARTALAALLAAAVGLTILKGLLRFFDDYLVGSIALSASRDLSNELMDSLLRQPVRFFEQEGPAVVSSRFTADLDEVVRALKTLTGTIFREPLQFVFLLGLAILISPLLTLASFVLFPILAVLIRVTGRVAKRSAKQVLASRSRILSLVQETFSGIRVVQGFRAERRALDRYRDETRRLLREHRRLVRVEASASPAMETLVVAGVVGALFLGGTMALDGRLKPNELITFYGAIGALYEPIRKLGSATPRIQAGLAGAGRIFDYLDRRPEIREAPGAAPLPPFSREIRFDGVSFSYDGRSAALTNVDLTIEAGEQIALVGPSGGGKSTLAALLLRFLDATEGVVRIDGRDVASVTLDSLRGQIAMVPQHTFLMAGTLRENIAYGRPEATDAEIREAARIAHVLEFADRLPEGLDTPVGDGGTALSGGQRQRVAIARALLVDPRILILDEATSNVDEESARLIRAALAEARRGRTTILVTHRLDALAASDRVVVVASGRIEAVGVPQEVLGRSDTFRVLSAAGRAEPAS